MPVRLQRFEMPKTLVKIVIITDIYAKFMEPFEASYGHTLGNSFARPALLA
jgi:DNA-directed RNA polymerase alpha subunit